MRGTFGWDLPPGVTQRHIDEACGEGIDPREAYGEDQAWPEEDEQKDEDEL